MRLSFAAFCLALSASMAMLPYSSTSVDAFVPHYHYQRYQRIGTSSDEDTTRRTSLTPSDTKTTTALNYINNADHDPEVVEDLVDMAPLLRPTAATTLATSIVPNTTIVVSSTPPSSSQQAVSPMVARMATFLIRELSSVIVIGLENEEGKSEPKNINEEVAHAPGVVLSADADHVTPTAAAARMVSVVEHNTKTPLPYFAKAWGVDDQVADDQSTTTTTTTNNNNNNQSILPTAQFASENHAVKTKQNPSSSSRETQSSVPYFATRISSSEPVATNPMAAELKNLQAAVDVSMDDESKASDDNKVHIMAQLVDDNVSNKKAFSMFEEVAFQHSQIALEHSQTVLGTMTSMATTASAAWESVVGLARKHYDAATTTTTTTTSTFQQTKQPRQRWIVPSPPTIPPKIELFDTATILQQVADRTTAESSSSPVATAATDADAATREMVQAGVSISIAASKSKSSSRRHQPARQQLDFADIDSILLEVESALEVAEAAMVVH